MADRPSRLWKDMPLERRIEAADAFWRDTESPEVQTQQVEAMVLLARRLNFRARSIQTMSVERRARHLAQVTDLPDLLASRALVAYHFAHRRPLMAGFLDALGVPHENGLITAEEMPPPEAEALSRAVAAVNAAFDPADVDLYLRTLVALDGDTWGLLDGLLSARS
jgi:hypothetical protein